jgi:hypothetical protein
METEIFAYCIYTMRHSAELDRAYRSGGGGTFEEGRAWVTGSRLFEEAQRHGLRMPIIFSAAERDSGLIYFGFLESVKLDETEEGEAKTTDTFRDLRPISEPSPKSILILKNTGSPLSEQYIRPYAVCETPTFIAVHSPS